MSRGGRSLGVQCSGARSVRAFADAPACAGRPGVVGRLSGGKRGGALYSTLWEAFVGSGIAAFQRSGEALSAGPVPSRSSKSPGDVRSPAGGHEQAGIHYRRKIPQCSPCVRTVCPGQAGGRGTRGKSMWGKNKKFGRRRPKIALFSICPDSDYPGFFCRPSVPENAISKSSERRCCRLRT